MPICTGALQFTAQFFDQRRAWRISATSLTIGNMIRKFPKGAARKMDATARGTIPVVQNRRMPRSPKMGSARFQVDVRQGLSRRYRESEMTGRFCMVSAIAHRHRTAPPRWGRWSARGTGTQSARDRYHRAHFHRFGGICTEPALAVTSTR